jgi:hypothetical protein
MALCVGSDIRDRIISRTDSKVEVFVDPTNGTVIGTK